MAESKGFEPSNGFRPLHDFQSCSFDQLGQLSTCRRGGNACGNYNSIPDRAEKSKRFFQPILWPSFILILPINGTFK